MKNVLSLNNLTKKYDKFTMGCITIDIPCGFSTALIGSNGAGKTTLLETICGLSGKYEGQATFFEKYTNPDDPYVRMQTGYCSASLFPVFWDIRKTEYMMSAAFKNFSSKKFRELCKSMQIDIKKNQKILEMSAGTSMKLILAATLARDTDLLILDEPASALDPLMRDRLCGMFRNYLAEKDGERSVLFSTHNIADMEYVTDYAIIMANGKIIEHGFTEELKEKYCMVNGDTVNAEKAKPYMLSFTINDTIYEGLAPKENYEKLLLCDAAVETPSLQQISVELLRNAENEGMI